MPTARKATPVVALGTVVLGVGMASSLLLGREFQPLDVPSPYAASFEVRPADAASRMQVWYFLTGAFGGFGSVVRDPDQDGVYRIPLFVDLRTERVAESGTPAEGLRAILYAPGCQFDLVSVNLTATSTRSARFECRPLSSIILRGKVSPFVPDPGLLDVKILYMAPWGHQFFGIVDGPVAQFEVGRATLTADGRFQAEIPDFSKDSVTSDKHDAYLTVLVVERSGGNLVKKVLPPAALLYEGVGLKILPTYDSEVAFSPRGQGENRGQ